jgi:Transposase zinc-ribbon domain
MSIISRPYFWDEQAAHAKLAEIVWPDGPLCPHCGASDRIGAVTGKGARAGLKFCCRCRKQFRATIGTMFEGSHIPLHKWFQACFLLSTAGNAISAHQLHLQLEVTNKTALGMVHRLGAIIAAAHSDALDDGGDWPLCARPAGRARGQSRRRSARTPSAIGWEDLPWLQFPTQPRRQFLRFVETVRDLGCLEDHGAFDRVLTKLGTHGMTGNRISSDASFGGPSALGFTRPPPANLQQVSA